MTQYTIDLRTTADGLVITVLDQGKTLIEERIDPRTSRTIANGILKALSASKKDPEPAMPLNRAPLYERSVGGFRVWVYLVDGATALIGLYPHGVGLSWISTHRLQPRVLP